MRVNVGTQETLLGICRALSIPERIRPASQCFESDQRDSSLNKLFLGFNRLSYCNCGCRTMAHSSLAATLAKLNTGLVGIIAAFISHDSKSTHLNMDWTGIINDVNRKIKSDGYSLFALFFMMMSLATLLI